MSVHRIPVNDLKQLERIQEMLFEEIEFRYYQARHDHCSVEHPECKAWQKAGGCCRQGVLMNTQLVLLAALAMAYNGTVDNSLLHRILDNKNGGSWIEEGCLVIDMWDDKLGEMPLLHNPPAPDPY